MGETAERSKRRWPRLWLAGMALLAAGCVGVVDDPVGDAIGANDIVEAGVDYRRNETRFWIELNATPSDPRANNALWCVDFQSEPDCVAGGDNDVFIRLTDNRYFVEVIGRDISCIGFADSDGRTYSVRFHTHCLTFGGPVNSSLRFRAAVFGPGSSDDTAASSPVFISD